MALRHFLSISDFSAEEIKDLINEAIELKKQPIDPSSPLLNRTMGLFFDKNSLRTNLSFQVGMAQLGGLAIYLPQADVGINVRESVEDVARVTSRMVDIIAIRMSDDQTVRRLAEYSSVPVINAMTDREHPCQIMADLQTICEHFGSLDGLKLAYVGDANNNVTNSLALAAELLGIELSIAAPKSYEMSKEIMQQTSSVKHTNEPAEAVRGANVVVTDTWVSMGKEAESASRLEALAPYQVNRELMALADKAAIFMHCLPLYRGKEVTDEVAEGPQSVIFSEAENRLHAQKAVILRLIKTA